MGEGHKLPGGSGSMPPRKFFENDSVLRCNLVHLETQSCYSVLRQGTLTSCALTSSRLDDFSDIVTYVL